MTYFIFNYYIDLLTFFVPVLCVFALGLLNGPMFRRFTYRQVAIFGASLVVFSLYLTSISNSFTTYLITFSILYGNFALESSICLFDRVLLIVVERFYT